ncbi:outer membrane protein assembly factor BamB family protein [Thermomonospora amylolytica]|uniref:outer membrane protein assembly factor BamB family protein n=1 Tax=Thermomonospora amylolytica TaxID=1411117 RepID=UPI001F1E4E8D|nr:PQQ-binding-like beta-propeller repeat protein [Thermomonospora amylolytica]
MLAGAALMASGCSGTPGPPATVTPVPRWSDPSVNAVSRPMSGSGVTAVTALRPDGALETAVYDLATGNRRWSRPATMAGRPPGLGVQPPAVAGPPAAPVVAALEPRRSGRWRAALVVRDARTGAQRWSRPVDSTFGPARCGPHVCLAESTARHDPGFVALDHATGRPLWRIPGIAEVVAATGRRVVVFRLTRRPVLESRDPRTGRVLWTFPVERAVGRGVNLAGGWAFAATGDMIVGYLAPYAERAGRPLSAFGFFGLRTHDGRPVWTRRGLLRVYPSPSPAVAPLTREVDARGRYGDFARLDPRTGRTLGRVPAERAPGSAWWLAFPADLSRLGFLALGGPGGAVDLRGGGRVPARGVLAWSFCTVDPAQLRIEGQHGFFPVAPLCAYDLGTGRKAADPGPPPGWYTGATDGWRVWRDEQGMLHAVRDTTGTMPGMYG